MNTAPILQAPPMDVVPECVICSVSMTHSGHEAMNMGCNCRERACRFCVRCGDLQSCPLCRKRRKHPTVDRQWMAAYAQSPSYVPAVACIGCQQEVATARLRSHERRCPSYRDYAENLLRQECETQKTKATTLEQKHQELEEQVDLQGSLIEELEGSCSSLGALVMIHQMEEVLYRRDTGACTQTLFRIASALRSASRRLQSIASIAETWHGRLLAARQAHREMQRKRRRIMEQSDVKAILRQTHDSVLTSST